MKLRRGPLAVGFMWATVVGFGCGWYAAQPEHAAVPAAAPVASVKKPAPVAPSASVIQLAEWTAEASAQAAQGAFSQPELSVTHGFGEPTGASSVAAAER